MAYTPYEWTVNSYLNPTRMNAIEQGIAAASQAAESASGEFHTIEELIGTQSIAGIGDGTLTGATWKINNDLSDLKNTVTTLNSNMTTLTATVNKKVTTLVLNDINDISQLPDGFYGFCKYQTATVGAPTSNNDGIVIINKYSNVYAYEWAYVCNQTCDIYKRSRYNKTTWSEWVKV